MNHPEMSKKSSSRRAFADLHPIRPESDLGRWIASQDCFQFSLEEALADFAHHLRMGKN